MRCHRSGDPLSIHLDPHVRDVVRAWVPHHRRAKRVGDSDRKPSTDVSSRGACRRLPCAARLGCGKVIAARKPRSAEDLAGEHQQRHRGCSDRHSHCDLLCSCRLGNGDAESFLRPVANKDIVGFSRPVVITLSLDPKGPSFTSCNSSSLGQRSPPTDDPLSRLDINGIHVGRRGGRIGYSDDWTLEDRLVSELDIKPSTVPISINPRHQDSKCGGLAESNHGQKPRCSPEVGNPQFNVHPIARSLGRMIGIDTALE